MLLLPPGGEGQDGGGHMPRSVLGASRRQAEVSLLHDRRSDHLRRLAIGHELPVVQHDDAVRELAHHVHLVLDQEDGLRPVFLERADQVEDHRRLGRVHAGRRFVEHEDLRFERHQERDFELALVAVGQACDRRMLLGLERDLGQDRIGALGQRAMIAPDAPEIEPAPVRALARRLHREAHVLEHREIGKEIRQLEGPAQPGPRARRGALPRQQLPVEQHRAGRRLELPRDQVEVGGLARAVRADDRGQRARCKAATDIVDRDMASETDGESARFEHRASACSLPGCPSRTP